MIRYGCCLMLLVALAAPRIEAQAQSPPSKGRVAFSVREAPENLVYRIFLSGFMGSQRAADQRRDQGEDDAELRALFQRRLHLSAVEHQALISAAQTCVAVRESNSRVRQELTAELRLTQDKAPLRTRLQQLAQADEAAVADAVAQLRLALGAGRFAELDWMIRVHVVPKLKVVPASRRGTAPPGGK